MSAKQIAGMIFGGFILVCIMFSANGLESKSSMDEASTLLLGKWQIHKTKEPGNHYRRGYKGRPFVAKGPHAFTLIVEYRKDGTFRRISRVGVTETIHEGKWTLYGHELRHTRHGGLPDEVMYIRFDDSDTFTSVEVFEDTTDPGLFAQFRRISR